MKRPIIASLLLLLLLASVWLWSRATVERSAFPTQNLPNDTGQPSASSHSSSPIAESIETNPPRIAPVSHDASTTLPSTTAKLDSSFDEWRTPIQFYGQVIDENTNPVPEAQIHFIWTDLSPSGNAERVATSDANGFFTLGGVSGKHLIVEVSKAGYYSYQPFGASFFYAGENHNFVPESANPVVFRLKKRGVAEPLIHIQAPLGGPKAFKIPRNGQPVEISLATGKSVPSGEGDLRVRCWTDDQGKQAGQKYAWKCEIAVPGGGLTQYSDDLQFEAPPDGYHPTDTIQWLETADPWSSHGFAKYFLKLPNGMFARINFEMVAGGDHFFRIESFFNPSGSRNLEYDPQMAINR